MIVSSYDSDTPILGLSKPITIFGYSIDAYLATPGRCSTSIDGGKTFKVVRWSHWRFGVRKFKLVKEATDGTLSMGPVRVVWMKDVCRPKRHLQAIAN